MLSCTAQPSAPYSLLLLAHSIFQIASMHKDNASVFLGEVIKSSNNVNKKLVMEGRGQDT